MRDEFKFDGVNLPKLDLSNFRPDYSTMLGQHVAESNRQMEEVAEAIQAERERKEAAETAYREETIRSLHAIEQNTANLYTLVDLISKSNEQQDELISIIAEVLTIAKAKSKDEAKSVYTKVMSRITQTIKDAETLAKIAGYATTVWQLAQSIIDKLPL
jgi:Fic family protein